MELAHHQLEIENDPWQSQDGHPLMSCDRSLLAAVIKGDVLATQVALLQGADPLTEICRTQGKECRSIAGLSTWHEDLVAKALLDVFGDFDYLDRNRFVISILTSSGMPIPQGLMAWFLDREATRNTCLYQESLWRFLAARKCWDVMTQCKSLLWNWENPHVGNNAYTAIFVWVRAIFSADPSAVQVKQWMTQALRAYEQVDRRLLHELVDEFAMQHALQSENPSTTLSSLNLTEEFSKLLVCHKSIRATLERVHDSHVSKPLFRAAIHLADAKKAQAQAGELAKDTPLIDGVVPRGRL